MKICIFGGAFDPVHKGHIEIAYSALETYNMDKLIFMVSKEPPHKSNHKVSFNHRFNMVKLVTDIIILMLQILKIKQIGFLIHITHY